MDIKLSCGLLPHTAFIQFMSCPKSNFPTLQGKEAFAMRMVCRLECVPEVELPHAEFSIAGGQVALRVREGQPQLYQLQHVHVAPEPVANKK